MSGDDVRRMVGCFECFNKLSTQHERKHLRGVNKTSPVHCCTGLVVAEYSAVRFACLFPPLLGVAPFLDYHGDAAVFLACGLQLFFGTSLPFWFGYCWPA